ncbi:MAG: UbiA family prenyltransferase [Xanthobacteraceae bacterium]
MHVPLAFHGLLLSGRTAMSRDAVGGMNWSAALRLGRVSNLPTVWTNVLAGIVLSGAALTVWPSLLLLLSLSLFYVAGMFLNDAFDREFDRRNRPDRPIPAGDVTAVTVFVYGFGLLACGLALLFAVGYGTLAATGWRAPAAGTLLAAVIVLYDAWHKENLAGPFVMGLCRLLVYVVAGVAVAGALPGRLVLAAIVALCYLIGLTYVAKQESLRRVQNLWPLVFLAVPFVYGAPFAGTGAATLVLYVLLLGTVLAALALLFRSGAPDVPHAVMLLIAGISLLDGLFMAAQGQPLLAAAAVAAFLLTLVLQRFVSGT